MKDFIVLAYDGSDASKNALQYCLEIFNPDSVQFVVVNISRPLPDDFGMDSLGLEFDQSELRSEPLEREKIRESMINQAKDTAERATDRLRESGFETHVKTGIGDPGEGISRYAHDNDADAIVLGRHGRGAVEDFLLGSVSHYLVHHADCPVILVPENFTV